MNVTAIKTKLSKYIDISYFIRFFVLLLCLYYFNFFYVSITDKKGMIYSSFLADNLNYISWLRSSVLFTSNVIAHAIGIHSYVYLPYILKTVNGSYVEMVYSCLGLGLMSFWLAFVIANNGSLKRKIIWSIAGIISIFFINSLRVALLLMAFENHWRVNFFLDHHTLFNLFAYLLIISLISLYIKNSKKAIKKDKLAVVSS